VSTDPAQLALAAATVIAGAAASALATAAETSLLILHARGAALPAARGGHLAHALLARQDRLVLSLRAFNLCGKIAAALAAALFFSLLLPRPPLAGFALGGVLALLGSLIVADIVPKLLPEESADAVSLFLAPFAWMAVAIMTPLVAPHLWLSRRLLRGALAAGAGTGEAAEAEASASENELRAALSLGEIEGVIEEDTRDIIEGIITFGDLTAADIMTPRADLLALPATALDDPAIVTTLRQSKRDRIVIYEKSIDHIAGVLDRREALLNPSRRAADFVSAPLYVQEARRLLDLLSDMKRSRRYFAVVLDEYGGTAGVVTMRDMLDEIVGELEAGR